MRLGEKIAEGRQAEVFVLGGTRVVKLMRDRYSPDLVAEEARRTRLIAETGFPVPEIDEVVAIGGRHGIVMERIAGRTLVELAASDPDGAVGRAQELAELQARLGQLCCPGLPSLVPIVRSRIAGAPLPAAERQRAGSILDACLPGDGIYHGDFHPANVIASPSGMVVIDWFNAATAHPGADLARSILVTRLAITSPSFTEEARRRIESIRASADDAYLQRYLRCFAVDIDELRRWMQALAAARLVEMQADGRGVCDYRTLHAVAVGDEQII